MMLSLKVGRLLLLSGLSATPVLAQMPFQVSPSPLVQPVTPEINTEDPYWRETVDKALAQFQSDDPEIRRSAVMLLGKYPVLPAQEAVAKGLEDPAATVRQAALVSVLEEPGMIHPSFTEPLLRLLADPAVSIRRIASNSVTTLVNSFPFGATPGTGQMNRNFPDDIEQILRDAFRDEDTSVRRNMVNHYPLLRIDLPEETLIALLHDPDAEVAVHALRWALPLLSPQSLSREVEALVKHESEIFRLELARALQSRPSPEALAALENLQSDPVPAVAIEAMLGLFYQRQSVELYEEILKRYRESGSPGNASQRIIFAAQLLGDQGEPFLRQWLEGSDPAQRQQAAQIYLNRFADRADIDFLLSLLEDPVQAVRQQAVHALIRTSQRLAPEHVRQTATNRHADVRRAAAGLAGSLPPDQAEGLLFELLLDDAREVQLAALQQIGQRRIEGWEEVLSISLRVDDPVTSRTALQWLMRHPTPKTLDILRAYRDENPQSPLRAQIEAHLQRHEENAEALKR